MIEYKTVENRRVMQGFSLDHTSQSVNIGEGTVEGSSLSAVTFDLIYDGGMPVLHDLYLVDDGIDIDYRLMVTYLDGRTEAYYDQDGKVFHRLMTVQTQPDGTYSGDFVRIVEVTPSEVEQNGEETEPPREDA